MNSIIRHTKRVIITVMGTTIIVAGVVMLVFPGPGWLVIIAGLAILATEYVWAKRLLEKAKEQAAKGAKAVSSGLRMPFGRKAKPEVPEAAEKPEAESA